VVRAKVKRIYLEVEVEARIEGDELKID